MKIITITGHKNTGKVYLARKLATNSGVDYIIPFTDKEFKGDKPQEYYDLQFVDPVELDDMIKKNDVLISTVIDDDRYVVFKSQLTNNYNVLIVDDWQLTDLMSNWDGELYTIKVKSKNQKKSDRVDVYLFDHEFDEVFDMDYDDYYLLEARIE